MQNQSQNPNDLVWKAVMEEEVRRLHSLWHIGPPPNPNPQPLTSPPFVITINNSTRIKKKKKRRNKKKNTKDIEWPCDPPLDPLPRDSNGWSSWSDATPRPPMARKIPTLEQLATIKALQAQQKSMFASKDYFSTKDSSDDEEQDDDCEEDVTLEKFPFFMDVFEKDSDLRDYYKQNYEKGEFYCLVCVGMGEKIGKTFGDCLSLVQHANSIAKTRGREAHRTLVKAICDILGWDVERLPTIVYKMSGEPAQSSSEASNSKVQQPDCSTEWPNNSPITDSCLPSTANTWNAWGNTSMTLPINELVLNSGEQMKITSLQVQQKGILACKEFFNIKSDDDMDDYSDEEDMELRKLGFFLDLFEKDGDLRDYYKQKFEKGEFHCLVCVGIGEKLGKTFGDCTSLVQHANTISKTKGREAHRAYGKVICSVLGWDMEKFCTCV